MEDFIYEGATSAVAEDPNFCDQCPNYDSCLNRKETQPFNYDTEYQHGDKS